MFNILKPSTITLYFVFLYNFVYCMTCHSAVFLKFIFTVLVSHTDNMSVPPTLSKVWLAHSNMLVWEQGYSIQFYFLLHISVLETWSKQV